MRIARSRGLDDDVAVAAQAFVHEAVVDRTGGEQRMHGQLVALERTIRQHEDHLARAHGGNRLVADVLDRAFERTEEHTSELQSLMRIAYAAFCLKKKKPSKT